MHQKLKSKGLNTDRVRIALKCLHPDGVKSRTSHRHRRCIYVSPCPNFTWHIDGYDKLKPFGLAIHGTLDGYSRKWLSLEVSATNDNPKVVSSFFLNIVKKLQLIPRCIRSDRGSENVIIGLRFFRRNHTDSVSNRASFRYGPSTRNQRIESWWSIFRRNRSNWWINFFKDLCHSAMFDPSLSHHINCLRFCFLGLLQSELDETRGLWNNHCIQKNKQFWMSRWQTKYFLFYPTN